MKNHNKKNDNIHIRNLSKSDNEMLAELREITGNSTNTKALMMAGNLYINSLKELKKYKNIIEKIENLINAHEK